MASSKPVRVAACFLWLLFLTLPCSSSPESPYEHSLGKFLFHDSFNFVAPWNSKISRGFDIADCNLNPYRFLFSSVAEHSEEQRKNWNFVYFATGFSRIVELNLGLVDVSLVSISSLDCNQGFVVGFNTKYLWITYKVDWLCVWRQCLCNVGWKFYI